MDLFCTDLDNTLIYSYKHDIGANKVNVEIYEGREVSFMTSYAFSKLKEINQKCKVVPVTTRTIQQYERIDLGLGQIEYALTCNGGVLLVNGVSDEKWYQDSLLMIQDSQEQICIARELLENEKRRTLDVRYIEELFLFTKCDEPVAVVEELKSRLDCALVDVFNNGVKVYVLPKTLTKGRAVERFRKYVNAGEIIAAGDSEFDISLVQCADRGMVPHGFIRKYSFNNDNYLETCSGSVKECSENMLFSDYLMNELLKI